MKFLIIRFSSIGDIVLTTPVIRALKQQLNGAEIHFLLKKSFSDTLIHNPYIDKLIFLDEDLKKTIATLKSEKYDAVIDLHKNIRSLKIKSVLGVKSFSFNKLNFKKWLYVNFKINLLPDIHIVDRYFQAVHSFGVTNDGGGLDYFITENDERALQQIPFSHRENYIAWVIGAKHYTKRLPAEKIISIGKKINSNIILLGDETDYSLAENIQSVLGAKVFNACGKFTLNQSSAIIKHAKRVITHDTGLMHIAAAFKKDIISIWGNTVPAFGMYPYEGVNNTSFKIHSVILEVKGLPCRPCSKIGFDECPKGHFKCMRDIDEQIFETIE